MTRCEKCGAYLDPEEHCGCDKTAAEKLNRRKVWEVLQSVKEICDSTLCSKCPFAAVGPEGPLDRCGLAAWPYTWDLESNPKTRFFKGE